MSRKDYIKLATMINAILNMTPRTRAELSITADLVYGIGTVLQQDNPKFDKQRFSNACLAINLEVK